MSEPQVIALIGATGLIGRTIIEQAATRKDIQILAIARREMEAVPGARLEMVKAEPEKWGEVLANVRPDAMISALGTTWKRAGKSEAAFRAVDYDLVLASAKAARNAGVGRLVAISSAGADVAARNFYLSVKGECDAALRKLGFDRLDILRPGLLRGTRKSDRRPGERLAILASPLVDPLLGGKYRNMRSIDAGDVAAAALRFASRTTRASQIHNNVSILSASRDWHRRNA